MTTVTAEELCDYLAALDAVMCADPVTPAQTPSGDPEIEVLLGRDVDRLPKSVADELYRAGIAPARIDPHAPGILRVLAR